MLADLNPLNGGPGLPAAPDPRRSRARRRAWFAVFGGLIPIVGLALIGPVLWRAVKPPEKPKPPGADEDADASPRDDQKAQLPDAPPPT